MDYYRSSSLEVEEALLLLREYPGARHLLNSFGDLPLDARPFGGFNYYRLTDLGVMVLTRLNGAKAPCQYRIEAPL